MSRGGKVIRRYRHNLQILQKLSEATGKSSYSIKRTAVMLCKSVNVEFPSLTIEEWKRRYS